MTTPAALRQRVLQAIEPTAERTREARALAEKLAKRITREAIARGIHVEPRLVGSLAKDTHLADPLDVDLFILFPRATTRDALEKDGVALGKKVLRKPVLKYAEHPYVHGRVGDVDVDIVPAYKLDDPTGKLSAVDRTPFHTEYVRRHATQRHRAEIRLLKRFLRGTRTYGAETSTGGLSGYLAELLVLRYGTFDKALKAVASWKAPIELSLTGTPIALGGRLVFVDPVDASRNAAAAVSGSTLDRLQRAAHAFRRRPRWEFFFPNEPAALSKAALAQRLRKHAVVGVSLASPPGRPETILPRSQRLLSKIRRQLETEGFEVLRAEAHHEGDARVLLMAEHRPARLPPTFDHQGPRASDAENAARFVEKWKKRKDVARPPRLVSGRWTVTLRRRNRTPQDLLKPQMQQLIQGFDLPKDARPLVLSGPALAATAARRLPLTLFLERLDPWEY